jgi:transposase InsO family protein
MPLPAQAILSGVVKAPPGLPSGEETLPSRPEPVEVAERNSPTSGKPAGSLALATAHAGARDGGDPAQAKAGEVFRCIIEPIINPERYAELHRQHPQRSDLVRYLAEQHRKTPRTVYRLLAEYEKHGMLGLLRRIRADKGLPRVLNAASMQFIVAAALPEAGVRGELTNADVWRIHEEERRFRERHARAPLNGDDKYASLLDSQGCFLRSALLSPASYRTFCREIAKIPEIIRLMARSGEEAYRNAELISFRDFSSIHPMDYVVMDHRVLDLHCLVPVRGGWKLARPWITAAIDMRTRKWLGWLLCEVPSSDSIATVLKQVFLAHGLPKGLYWDNGRDFRCRWLEGGRERDRTSSRIDELPRRWMGVLESLGVRVHHAIVRNARAKLIEPNFGRMADFERMLPEYCGNFPGTRPENFDKMVRDHHAWLKGKPGASPFRTIEEIAALYDELLEKLNEDPLRGEGMAKTTPTGRGWMCPNEAWELLIPRIERRTIPEELLGLVFCKRQQLKIRNGEAQMTLAGKPYHYRLTENRTGLLGLNGKSVTLAYDPFDLERGAVYFEERFIGLADCIALRRMGEDAFKQDERDRRATRREVKRFIGNVHRSVPVPDPETYLSRRRAVAPKREEPERAVVPVQVPAQIEEAHAARLAESAFSFEEPGEAIVSAPPAEPDHGDAFRFFSD